MGNQQTVPLQNKYTIAIARIVAKPGMEEQVKFALRSLIEPTRREIGCISYYFYQSVDDPTIFYSHETWQNKEELEKHLETPYIQTLRETAVDLLLQPVEVMVMESLG